MAASGTVGAASVTIPLPNDPDRKRFLLPFIRVIARSDVEIRTLLDQVAREAAADVARLDLKPGIGASVRANQLRGVQGRLAGHLASLWYSVGNVIRAKREEAIRVALEAGMDWDKQLLMRAAHGDVRAMLRRTLRELPNRNIRNMIARYTRETIPLSQKVYHTQQLAGGWVDQKVNSGLGRGLSARELAKEVRDMIRSDVRGGVSYAAMRLARTEINAANKYASETDNAEKPFVDNIEWRLSKSHPRRDICDVLAEQGPYPKDEVPATPHPQCFCYQVPKVIDEDEFVKNLQGGEYDKYLSDKYDLGDEFPKEVEKQKIAPVVQILERQPQPAEPVAPIVPKKLDLAQAAWHSGRLLQGDGYDALPDEDKSALHMAVVNTLEGLPEKKVAALRAIKVGEMALENAGAEYASDTQEIHIRLDSITKGRNLDRNGTPGFFSDTGDQRYLQAVINHEMGHHLDIITDPVQRHKMYEAMIEVDAGWHGSDFTQIDEEWVVDKIGTYAATNRWELIAELYAQFRGNGKQSPLSKVVGEWLHKDLP